MPPGSVSRHSVSVLAVVLTGVGVGGGVVSGDGVVTGSGVVGVVAGGGVVGVVAGGGVFLVVVGIAVSAGVVLKSWEIPGQRITHNTKYWHNEAYIILNSSTTKHT